MSESNRTVIRYVPEVTYGTTPVASANWKLIPHNSDSLSAKAVTVESQRIRTDRMVQDQIKVNEENGGAVNFELTYGDFDDLIAAAMCGAWAVNVVTLGTTDNHFTVEKEFADITKFMQVKGARVGGLDLSFRFGEVVTGAVTFAGSKGFAAGTSLVGAGSTAAASANPVMAGNVDIDAVTYDGISIATSGIEIDEITLSIQNNLRPNYNLLNAAPTNQRKGTARVTGRIKAYLSAAAWVVYENMLANAEVDLSWTITDSGNKGYTFSLPKIKLNGDAPTAGGQDQDVVVEANFLCFQTAPTITRIP